MKTIRLIFGLVTVINFCSGQGFNHQWLLGNFNFIQDPKGRMFIDNNNFNIVTEYRKMAFKGTQGNICDSSGNLLMASNGVWIANATGDTMMNGSGINPGNYVNNWPNGTVIPYANAFLHYPGNQNQYILFHHTGSPNIIDVPSLELFYTVIDMTMDSGNGGVTAKNTIIIQDTISWGLSTCRHSNGRDWWIVAQKDSSNQVYVIEFTDNGINNITLQSLMYSPFAAGNSTQITFSPQGDKLVTANYDNPIDRNSFIVISDFNRCTGIFSNTQTIQLTSGSYLWGLAFSPSGKYAYACSSTQIFQIDTDTYLVDTVADYDGFISPPIGGFPTTFWNMYLAANGKIYITSGSGVQHLHEMNYPDSAGIACDVQQHAIDLVNYLHLRAVPNHPNYYLGCDTTLGCPCLTSGMEEANGYDFKFSVSPNPTSGSVKLIYMLPQNQSGKLEIFDLNGRQVYEMRLPPWSTLQQMDVSFLSGGVYSCVVSSNGFRNAKKLVVVRE